MPAAALLVRAPWPTLTFAPLGAVITRTVTVAAFAAPAAVGWCRLPPLFKLLFVHFSLNGFGDVDAPACEFGREPGVLSVLADGKGELSLRNGHHRGMIRFAQFDAQRLHRAERICYKVSRIGAPLDNIYLFFVEFMHAVIDTRTTHPDARADRIQAFLACDNRNLGAAAGFARDSLDFDGTFVDFGYFGLKQAAHEVTMGT